MLPILPPPHKNSGRLQARTEVNVRKKETVKSFCTSKHLETLVV